jgi:hypothetical protein
LLVNDLIPAADGAGGLSYGETGALLRRSSLESRFTDDQNWDTFVAQSEGARSQLHAQPCAADRADTGFVVDLAKSKSAHRHQPVDQSI